VKFLGRKHDQPFLLVVSLMNPHNICEWARRGAGRVQRLSCGEIGTPPDSDQLPPAPANLAPPKNEPDGMVFIRRAYQVEDGKFPVGTFTPEDWRKQRWGYYRMVEKVDGIKPTMEGRMVRTDRYKYCLYAHGNRREALYDMQEDPLETVIGPRTHSSGPINLNPLNSKASACCLLRGRVLDDHWIRRGGAMLQ
jgi:hypothetical protein